MSVNDPIILRYNEKRGLYYLTRGRETFYDYERYLIEFETQQEAIDFCYTELNELPKIPKLEEEIKDGALCYKPKPSHQAVQLSLDLAL